MSDEVRDLWRSISSVLAERAPRTSACLNPPASQSVLSEVQECSLGRAPDSLLQSLTCHDGMQLKPLHARLFPPSFIPYSAAGMVASHKLWREIIEVDFDASPDVEGLAGEDATSYSPRFLPIATDTAGDEYFIDLRDGEMHGCIRRWYQSSGAVGEPLWPSFQSLIEDVANALRATTEDSTHSIAGYRAIFEDHSVLWRRA
ncbi:SMI1/KNR4 family protein [Streptomyces sp. NPDC006365]|uniref:SMI1/KNR4 family protein n=1 Tax=Streptomyces sp. NPDC006365 TaxID=3364744 RepID=UPI0036A00611